MSQRTLLPVLAILLSNYALTCCLDLDKHHLTQVLKAKKDALPTNIIITELKCEIPLNDLLRHEIFRLVQFLNLPPGENTSLVLKLKYGFDGTSANAYKQRWDGSGNSSEECIFCTSVVPLQLVQETSNKPIWINPRPSSTRFCSPVRIQFVKETTSICIDEEKEINHQIANLQSFEVDGYFIKCQFYLTMIDGKVNTALNDSSSMKCQICKSTISELNSIDKLLEKKIDIKALQYGFPILHARIRFLEFVLHVAERIGVNKWQISKKNSDDKERVEQRKINIKNGLREKLGILVNTPKQNYGSTNDGNTARKFFNNPAIVAEITGFDQELLERFQTILATISCGAAIDKIAFQYYCLSTARKFVHLYAWFYMPPSVHIILIHGHQIIDQFDVPIGMLSEEAQECRNKEIKNFRQNHSRKTSRLEMNRDMFERLLLSSSWVTSLKRKLPSKKQILPTEEIKNLLLTNIDEQVAFNLRISSDSESETDDIL